MSTTTTNYKTLSTSAAADIANNNKLDLNITNLKNLESGSPNKVLFMGYELSTSGTETAKYILYREQVTYTNYTHPNSLISGSSNYTLRIYAYIEIPVAGNYIIENPNSDSIKIVINGYDILNKTSSINMYFKSGTYQLMISKTSGPTNTTTNNNLNTSLTIRMYPSNSTATNNTQLIDAYISTTTKYTLLNTITTARDKSTTNYCKPDTNLFTSNSICETSLNNTSLLQNTLNDYCIPNNVIKKDSNNKINPNCKKVYLNTSLNSTINTDFNNKYNQWASNVIKNNTISDNKDALEEYISWKNPSETTFPIDTNLTNYCETNISDYNITPTNSALCNTLYTRTYTSDNKTKVDNSIQKIRHNYCRTKQSDGSYKNITTIDCQNELQKSDLPTNTLLETDVNTYCFPNNATSIRKGTDSLYDSTCKNNIHNLSNLNTNIKNKLNSSYAAWAKNTITNTNTTFAKEEAALNEYIKDKKPDQFTLFGIDSNNKPINATTQLTDYCKAQIGDKYQADPTTDALCNRLYTNNNYNTNPTIVSSIKEIKQNYCKKSVLNSETNTTAPRYETDPLCKNDYTTDILQNTIKDRCIKNNTYQEADDWCNTISDANINTAASPYPEIISARTLGAKNALNTAVSDMNQQKLAMNSNYYKYLTNTYNSYTNKKINDEVLTQKLFDFCETKEPNYPTDSTSQCKGIYENFEKNGDDNSKYLINLSQNKMRDSLCIDPNNITTNNPNDKTTNAFNCNTIIFDTTNLGKFAQTVNNHCATGNNIASTECQTYYKDIEDKLLKSYGISSTISQFQNKYEDIELEPFKNYEFFENTETTSSESTGVEPTSSESTGVEPTSSESTGVEPTSSESTGVEPTSSESATAKPTSSESATAKPAIKYLCKVDLDPIQTLLSDNEFNDSKVETESTEFMYYLLLFVFVILITLFLTTCMTSNREKNTNTIDSSSIIKPVSK